MKKIILLTTILCTSFFSCDTAKQILDTYGNTMPGGGLSNTEIISGLKEALTIGTQRSSNELSRVDGFFKNAAIKILMPEEAKKVESTLRSVGMGNVVDKAILSMNRAARRCCKRSRNHFYKCC